MKLLFKYLLVTMITLGPIVSFAQSNLIASASDSTDIKGQFESLYKKSTNYQQNKVIPMSSYNTLKKNAIDSIQLYKKEATNHLTETRSINQQLETSKTEITQLKEELATTQSMQNSIQLLGMSVSKAAYILIIWGIVLSLTLISAILFLLFKRGHQVVKVAQTRLIEVQADLEKLRKNGIAREQALGQELTIYKLNHK